MPEPEDQKAEKTQAKARAKTAAEHAHASSVYDLAIFLGNSLGPALPFIVVIGLVTFGAFWGIGKMTDFQTKLNDAQLQLSEAKLAQQKAEDTAAQAAQAEKIKSLQENSEGLIELNDRSSKVSASIQDLVSKQIESMKQASAFSEDQLSRSKAELANLKTQSEDLRKKVADFQAKQEVLEKDVQLASTLGPYNEILKDIDAAYQKGSYFDPGELPRLSSKLKQNDVILTKARSDLNNPNGPWAIRTVLALLLYQTSRDASFLKEADNLITQNKSRANVTIAGIFDLYLFDFSQSEALVPVLARYIVDGEFPVFFRGNLLTSSTFGSSASLKALSAAEQRKIALFAGGQLLSTNTEGSAMCYRVKNTLTVLSSIAPDAELVYSTRVGQKLGGFSLQDNACIRESLDHAIAGRTPTQAQLQEWP